MGIREVLIGNIILMPIGTFFKVLQFSLVYGVNIQKNIDYIGNIDNKSKTYYYKYSNIKMESI